MTTELTPQSESSASTSLTLLERVKANDPESWRRLCDVYGPLVYQWARGLNVEPEDAMDVVQDVFQTVAQKIKSFQHENFRGWLWRIARSRVFDHFRQHAKRPVELITDIENLPDVPPEDTDEMSRAVTRHALFHRALESVRVDFKEVTWIAFWRVTVGDESPSKVAEELGISADSVYQAKSRIMRRIREEFGDLLD